MDKDIELIANDVAELVKARLGELMTDTERIPYAAALAALGEIKDAVNKIRPDLQTVLDVKHILDKYGIDPLDQFYFVARAKMDAAQRKRERIT